MLSIATRALSAYHANRENGDGNASATSTTKSIVEVLRTPNWVTAYQRKKAIMKPVIVAPGKTGTSGTVPMKSRAASHCTRTSRRNKVSKKSELRAPPTAKPSAMHQAENH